MTKTVKFGNIEILLDRLLDESQIVVKKGDKIVMKQKAPLDIIDLLIRRKVVQPSMLSQKTKETYRKLHKISGRGMDKLDKQIILISKPEDALERLHLLKGSQRSGNDSKKLRNDIIILTDYLLKHKIATKQELDLL